METFAERLKVLREEKGLSMEGLAKALKVSSSSVHRWEHQSDIKASQLIILARFFGVSTDYLLGLEN